MKIKFILTLVCTLIIQFFIAQTEVKKPEEAFGLYFGAFLKNDEGIQKALNDYMRPTVEGQDMYNFHNDLKDQMKENIVKSYVSMLSKPTAQANKAEIEAFFDILIANFRNSKYKIKSVNLVDNEYQEGEKIAELVYDVTFKIPETSLEEEPEVSAYINKQTKNLKPEELKKILTVSLQNLKNATKEITIEQNFSLYTLKQDNKVFYYNGNPSEIVTNLTDFYFDNTKF
ncbi:hypothetical protein I6H88_09350 [Elizabethkingia bruuniana]|uniref:DUF4919 domain-containing protein n=1 Tax=Elizabethkingia bruuniana TaxID=1756149 RepID=A0A7T7V2M8_9FLAO|nr:hypothetical protein [Elizabethkingia bruuniana]KGO08162.1 hypothetical protein KS04_20240 [Elizabethkingia miricola]AQX87025.1 hypothetical protein AYC65_19320 [Elizabethkingia bruuniana]KUY26729.1 hypothetical protein ATB97_04270 [Elizabethkingia bruuniana]OPB66830.1 hypothetical protein BAY12_04880 [Elizabethkingia bruuniana]QDZ63856.1 hypothetical protein EVD20_16655 [Elizabethkingia bruuniana]